MWFRKQWYQYRTVKVSTLFCGESKNIFTLKKKKMAIKRSSVSVSLRRSLYLQRSSENWLYTETTNICPGVRIIPKLYFIFYFNNVSPLDNCLGEYINNVNVMVLWARINSVFRQHKHTNCIFYDFLTICNAVLVLPLD